MWNVAVDAHWQLVEVEVHIDVEVVVILNIWQPVLLLIDHFAVYLTAVGCSCGIHVYRVHRPSRDHTGDGLEGIFIGLNLFIGIGDDFNGGAI